MQAIMSCRDENLLKKICNKFKDVGLYSKEYTI